MSESGDAISKEAVDAWARLVRVSQVLLSAVESDLKADGFPPLSWYDVLLELRRAGPGGLRPFELERAMLLAQYNISRLVERLLKAGYVARRPCEEDARGQILSITPHGERLLRRMWPAYRAAIRRHFADRLGDGDAEALARILGRLDRAWDGA